jgi:hypothetical protein
MSSQQPLNFDEVASLINKSRNTEIILAERRELDGAGIYPARDKIRGRTFPFEVAYIPSIANNTSLSSVLKRIPKAGEKLDIVFPPTFAKNRIEFMERVIRAGLQIAKDQHLYTLKDYLLTFINEELQEYRGRLIQQKPEHFSLPKTETPSGFVRKSPNPLLSFLSDPTDFQTKDGALAILLAEPGQGKTYLSRHLVGTLCEKGVSQLPIFVDSTQWQSMAVTDLESLWKTIVHSFRHFDASIGWLEGCEDQFLRTTLKAAAFCIVFDGFDEYILRNKGSVDAVETLEKLNDLVSSTSARVLITSRTSFWNEWISETQVAVPHIVYELQPFDVNEARNYFSLRLKNEDAVNKATGTYSALRAQSAELIGRGFALSLIADLFDAKHELSSVALDSSAPLWWLVKSLCQREVARQKLPIDADTQLQVIKTFKYLTASGFEPSEETLFASLEQHAPELDADTIRDCVRKFSSHPILFRQGDLWVFSQTQVEVMFLAKSFMEFSKSDKVSHIEVIDLDSDQQHDLAEMVVSMIPSSEGNSVVSAIDGILKCLRSDQPSRFGAFLAMIATNRFKPKGFSRRERGEFFNSIFQDNTVTDLSFSGTVSGLDLHETIFSGCEFDKVAFVNCEFGPNTRFVKCRFLGSLSALRCSGFTSAKRSDCKYDQTARDYFDAMEIEGGSRSYSSNALRRDFECVIEKFIGSNRTSICAIRTSNLIRGPIGVSKYKSQIIDAFMSRILETHHISGISEGGINVRSECMDAIKFYASNNVFTGPLRQVFDQLERDLGLLPE